MSKIRTRSQSKKELFDHFNDSDIEDADDFLFEENIDESSDYPYELHDIDPLLGESSSEDEEIETEQQSDIYEKSNIKWKRGSFIPDVVSFQQKSNPNCDPEKSPLEYFKKYFDDELFERFATYTNIYAQQQNKFNVKTTNSSEIKILFGLHMLMGYIKLPRVRMYWSPELNLEIFKSSMTCDRFFQLRNHLHIVNNLEKPDDCTDKFYKVRPLLEAIRKRILQFEVDEVVSIDEQIIPFDGRLVMKVYMKDKPNKWGLKVYILCGKDGLPYDFFIYQGNTTELSEIDVKNLGFCASVVLHLAKRLDSPGHKLFYDNYFSNYHMLEIMKARGINVAGTIRLNRFAKPPLLSDKEMKKQGRGHCDNVVSENGSVCVVKWQDNKPVHMASNFVGVGLCDTAKRWDKQLKRHVDVNRPEVICAYNNGMGGVDLLDQFISYYRVFIRSKKWALRVIFHFMDFAVCSSWVEYRKDQENSGVPKKKIKDLLHFRKELAYSLIKVGNPVRVDKRGSRTSENQSVKRRKPAANQEFRPPKDVIVDGVDHMPLHDCKDHPTRCKHAKCKGRTFFECKKCKVHLCISKSHNCFSEFHEKKMTM